MDYALIGRRGDKIDMTIPDETDPKAEKYALECLDRGGVVYRVPVDLFWRTPSVLAGRPWPWPDTRQFEIYGA